MRAQDREAGRSAGTPSPGFDLCPECRGFGMVAADTTCRACRGDGEVANVRVPSDVNERFGYCLECGQLADVIRRSPRGGWPDEWCREHDTGLWPEDETDD